MDGLPDCSIPGGTRVSPFPIRNFLSVFFDERCFGSLLSRRYEAKTSQLTIIKGE